MLHVFNVLKAKNNRIFIISRFKHENIFHLLRLSHVKNQQFTPTTSLYRYKKFAFD